MNRRAIGDIINKTATLCIGLVSLASIQCQPALAQAQPLVLFFGGHGSSATDMRKWKSAARQDPQYGTRFAFDAIPYPSDADGDGASSRAGLLVAERLAIELASTPQRQVILAGHSSGANMAAAVLARLREGGNVRLIVLDGSLRRDLKPPRGFRRDLQFDCWSAKNGQLTSVNRVETMALCRNYRELKAPKCRTAVCLHFWLVNKNTPLALDYSDAGRSSTDGNTIGYQNLQINLDWLETDR